MPIGDDLSHKRRRRAGRREEKKEIVTDVSRFCPLGQVISWKPWLSVFLAVSLIIFLPYKKFVSITIYIYIYCAERKIINSWYCSETKKNAFQCYKRTEIYLLDRKLTCNVLNTQFINSLLRSGWETFLEIEPGAVPQLTRGCSHLTSACWNSIWGLTRERVSKDGMQRNAKYLPKLISETNFKRHHLKAALKSTQDSKGWC